MNPLFDKAIAKQEADLGVPMDYLRKIAASSTGAFLKFGLFSPLALHRKVTPVAVWHLARLAATQVQDCGTCVQTVVNAALNDGIPASLLRAALDGGDLGADHQLVWDYGRAVAANSDEVLDRVTEVRERWGEDALVELALSAASTQMFPLVKRGLGMAVSCSLVSVDIEETSTR